MNNVTSLKQTHGLAYIVLNNEAITDISKSFLEMTEFGYKDLIDNSIEDTFELLRIGPYVNYEHIDEGTEYFLFTKELEVKLVNINIIRNLEESIYIFNEKPNSKIESRLPLANALCLEDYRGIAIFSVPDMTLLKANDKYISFFDEAFNLRRNCIGRPACEFITGFKGSIHEKAINNVLKTGKVYNVDEYVYEGFSRGITYWQFSIIPVCDEDKIEYCVVMATEITDSILHKNKIEEQAKIIRNQADILRWQAGLLNLSKESIFAWELDGGIIYWNKGAEESYGYKKEEALGRVSHQLLKTTHKESFSEIRAKILNQGIWNGEIEHIKKDGTRIVVESSHQLIEDEDGRKIILEINRDITERRKAEEDLINQRNQLEDIIQSIDDAIFIYNTGKQTYLTNNAAKKYFKGIDWLAEELTDTKFYDLKGNEINIERIVISRVLAGEVLINTRIVMKNEESIKYLSINGRPIYDREGKVKFGIISCRDITQDIEANKIIEQQKKELELILDNINDVLMIVDKERNYIRSNRRLREWIKACDNDELREKLKSVKYYDLNGKPLALDELPSSRILKGETLDQYNIMLRLGEAERYLSLSGRPIYDENGTIAMGVFSSRNITEMLKQSTIIKEQKQELEAIIDNITEELYIIDKNRNYLMLNKAARDRNKYFKFNNSDEYVENCRLYQLSGKDVDFDDTPVARLARGEVVTDEVFILHDPEKRYILVNCKPILDDCGRLKVGIMLSEDITTRVLQEQQIKHQNIQLKAILESMPDALILIDEKRQIKFLNEASKPYFLKKYDNFTIGEFLKTSKCYYGIDGELIPEEELPVFYAMKNGSFENCIITIQLPGKKMYASINGSTIISDSAKEAILSVRDITDQVMQEKSVQHHQYIALQAEKEKSEALEKAIEMKDEFLSIISHEFRTPLNVISSAVQAINYLCENELSEKSKKYLSIIRQNTFRQLRLVNNLLDITRADAGRIKLHKRNVDIVFLTKAIIESVNIYSSQKGVKVDFTSFYEQKIIAMDEEKYERILLNILSNATKFTPSGKFVSVKLRKYRNRVYIDIKDDGIGIPKDKLNIIFERFGQVDSSLSRQAEGAGIGLSLVKKLIDELEGTITVKSKVDRGSTFTISFPDERTTEEYELSPVIDLLENRLVEITKVEFSDIYL
ncbi:PAS domain-containing protein [Clostridium sp. C8-1-8]|uniref:sensor histidine kinase n=1 Tax=Clostridium sp. C8-1-8 TaxID=2698831 RepID=UPI00136AAC5A|nr:PAS domain-containing protein [Clostridium sp. C8-1-8]